jgi:hypothetical protein
MQDTFDKISRVIVKFNISSAHYSQKECTSDESWEKMIQPFKVPSMYYIPCECSKVMLAGNTIKMRCKGHVQH